MFVSAAFNYLPRTVGVCGCAAMCAAFGIKGKKERSFLLFFHSRAHQPLPDRYASAHWPCSYVQKRLQGLRPAGVTGLDEEVGGGVVVVEEDEAGAAPSQ